jgi:hypothetical protein
MINLRPEYECFQHIDIILDTSRPEWQPIPEHMRDGLQRWLLYGNRTRPGSFLRSVLQDNLSDSVANADHINILALPAYVRFLYNYCPTGCRNLDSFTGVAV